MQENKKNVLINEIVRLKGKVIKEPVTNTSVVPHTQRLPLESTGKTAIIRAIDT